MRLCQVFGLFLLLAFHPISGSIRGWETRENERILNRKIQQLAHYEQ